MPEKDDLDLLLDSALSNYADPGPDSGLEQRILSRIAESSIPASTRESAGLFVALRRRWVPWAIAFPIAAAIIVLLLFTPNTRQPSSAPKPFARQSAAESALPRPSVIKQAPPRSPHVAKTPAAIQRSQPSPEVAAAAPLPKLDVFPTPQPSTSEEQALAQIATQTPSPQLQALVQAQKNDAAPPLPVAAVHIPPLQPPTPDATDQ